MSEGGVVRSRLPGCGLRPNVVSSLCRYWMLDVSKVYAGGANAWDTAVHQASEEYKHRMVRPRSPSPT